MDNLERDILLTLWTLSNQSSYRDIAERFGVSKGKFVKCFYNMINLICVNMENEISWPTGQIALQTINKFAFPNTIGAMDGTYIQIDRPRENDTPNPDNYFNRKRFFSITLLAVCNADMKFTYVYSGGPSRFHDSRILRPISRFNPCAGRIILFPEQKLESFFYLIGI